MATVRDVAEYAGVSTATVSYVLNGHKTRANPVGDRTRRRVLEAAAALDYVPNQAARSLRRRTTHRVALVSSGVGVPWMDELASELQSTAEQHQYTLVILPVDSEERLSHAVQMMRQKLVDGAVIAPLNFPLDVDALHLLARDGCSLVAYSNELRAERFDVLRTTEREGIREAVACLVESGRRRIAYLADGPARDPDLSSERYRSFASALSDLGVRPHRRLVAPGVDRVQAFASTRRLLAHREPPDAIFSASDRGAIAALWAAHRSALRVPEDVAIVGVGNIPESEITDPPLSTVGPTSVEFGRVAELLFKRLGGDTSPYRALVEDRHFIRRGSA
ncbi:MAG: LacI family DNA-binding transcriptional regulator [Candidatus Dormibacteraeota bacterium]|nr:LacI family DNA-binding transcriptional regulator [Candidatus Dormibacteraeota bacterium]MBO0743531.1 LacI family DNA-binding transcriptional regulator [Candidatus Dormibacteraeota bacterium]